MWITKVVFFYKLATLQVFFSENKIKTCWGQSMAQWPAWRNLHGLLIILVTKAMSQFIECPELMALAKFWQATLVMHRHQLTATLPKSNRCRLNRRSIECHPSHTPPLWWSRLCIMSWISLTISLRLLWCCSVSLKPKCNTISCIWKESLLRKTLVCLIVFSKGKVKCFHSSCHSIILFWWIVFESIEAILLLLSFTRYKLFF